jgi:serine/threonine protein kinase
MQYAIKKPAIGSPEQLQILQRRASILWQLDHPCILKPYPLPGPEHALRLTLSPQGSLHDHLASGHAVDLRFIVHTTWQLATALAYAHSRGIVHGNLKAQNILFDRQGAVVLTDFDMPTPAFVQSPLVLHALPHRAPEQEQGYSSPATDQYQLAQLADSWLQQASSSLSAPPQTLSAFKDTLRTAHDADAALRYPDMHQFARELAKVAATLSQPLSQRTRPPAHRARPLLWSGVALFLLMILAGSWLAGLSLQQQIVSTLTPPASPPLSPQMLYQSIIHTRPLVDNPPAGTGVGQWILQHDRAGGSCSLNSATLSLASPDGPSSEIDCTLNQLNISNFAFQAEMHFIHTDPTQENMQAGLFFRNSYTYFLDVPLSECAFSAHSDPPVHQNTACTLSQAHNVLCVIARQHTFYLYLNQMYVATITDTHYSSGSPGVFLLNDNPLPGQMVVSFTNVKLWLL